jgi:hypothetical protein
VVSDKGVAQLFSLFDGVEVVDDHTNEKIDNELTTNDHEGYEVNDIPSVVVLFWLHVRSNAIDSRVHYVDPAFGRCHLKQGTHS